MPAPRGKVASPLCDRLLAWGRREGTFTTETARAIFGDQTSGTLTYLRRKGLLVRVGQREWSTVASVADRE